MDFCLTMLVSNARSSDLSCPIPDKPASHRTRRVHTLANSPFDLVRTFKHHAWI
jgi:hypothetical protein